MKLLKKSEDIAAGFIFLSSNYRLSVTGTTLEIDGGY